MHIPTKEDLWKEVEQTHGASTPKKIDVAAAGEHNEFPEPDAHARDEEVDPARLRSALSSIDPDADNDRTWVAYRIGALANAAKTRPELDGELFALAWQFSSGKLRGKPARTWTKKSEGRDPRRHRLLGLWQWFQRKTYSGRPVTLRTIYFHARQQGWEEEPFNEEPAAETPEEGQ